MCSQKPVQRIAIVGTGTNVRQIGLCSGQGAMAPPWRR